VLYRINTVLLWQHFVLESIDFMTIGRICWLYLDSKTDLKAEKLGQFQKLTSLIASYTYLIDIFCLNLYLQSRLRPTPIFCCHSAQQLVFFRHRTIYAQVPIVLLQIPFFFSFFSSFFKLFARLKRHGCA